MLNSVIAPLVVMRAILLASVSTNQRLSSGPDAIPRGRAGTGNSVMAPAVVILARFIEFPSVNQSSLSGPTTIAKGREFAVGIEYSATTPDVVMRPILLP